MPNSIEIAYIRERTDIDTSGQVIRVYEVAFKSAKGATGTMRFPVATYEPIAARKQIEEQAAKLDVLYG